MPKEIRGVDTNPKGREPRKMGRAEVAGSHSETIQESKYGDGQTRHGTDPINAHTSARTQRHRDGEAYRAGLRDSTK
jgi:hypothetical protein